MSATRTQIYLTEDQRSRLDEHLRRTGGSMASAIREALEAYLADVPQDAESALNAAFGALPDIDVPSREEWDRG